MVVSCVSNKSSIIRQNRTFLESPNSRVEDHKAYVKSDRILNVLELFAPSTCLSFELALWYGWVR